MYSLELYDPQTGASRGFIACTDHLLQWKRVAFCDLASHYFRAPTAALMRDRLVIDHGEALRVHACLCQTGASVRHAGAPLTKSDT